MNFVVSLLGSPRLVLVSQHGPLAISSERTRLTSVVLFVCNWTRVSTLTTEFDLWTLVLLSSRRIRSLCFCIHQHRLGFLRPRQILSTVSLTLLCLPFFGINAICRL